MNNFKKSVTDELEVEISSEKITEIICELLRIVEKICEKRIWNTLRIPDFWCMRFTITSSLRIVGNIISILAWCAPIMKNFARW